MKEVYIVDDTKIAKMLADPMRRSILDLLRQKPSLNHHMKILRSNKLVIIFNREVKKHRIMQIFLSPIADLFFYDLDRLRKNIT